MKIFKVKPNENLFAIFTYIKSDEYYLSLEELLQFCIDYEYYKEFYEHFHIIRALLEEHNATHHKIRDEKISGVVVDVPDVSPDLEDDDDSLL